MQINAFIGIYNKENARSIPDNALASAVDIDLSDNGVITRRPGYALTKAIANITSAYSTMDGTAYIVSDGYLCRLTPDLTIIRLAPSTATDFADAQ
jgi:hypothetical protein